MTNIETKLGLTNITKRLAYDFLLRGVGEHDIDHDVYDKVEVSELYHWKPHLDGSGDYGAGIKVTFYHSGHRVRWVEFAVRDIGGGGDLAIFRAK